MSDAGPAMGPMCSGLGLLHLHITPQGIGTAEAMSRTLMMHAMLGQP